MFRIGIVDIMTILKYLLYAYPIIFYSLFVLFYFFQLKFTYFLSFESKILELYLSANKLDKITRGQFNGLANLELLYIDKNQIEEIELNSFENLNNLKQLNIQSNRVKVIQDKLLGDKTKLETLNLYQNKICLCWSVRDKITQETTVFLRLRV